MKKKKPDPLKIGPPSFAGPDWSLSPPAVHPKETTSQTTWTVLLCITLFGLDLEALFRACF